MYTLLEGNAIHACALVVCFTILAIVQCTMNRQQSSGEGEAAAEEEKKIMC